MCSNDPVSPVPTPCGGPELAARALKSGEAKAKLGFIPTLVLGIMAGVYIGFAANFFTIMKTGNTLPFGVQQSLGGLCFCLGLILVVVGGAELFTGNTLITMAWLSGRVRSTSMLRNWAIVYAGNLIGSIVLVYLVVASGQDALSGGDVGETAMKIAAAKCSLTWGEVFFRGILCNALVCLAVWLCYGACTNTDRIIAILFPITAFVACGFEHCVANMYFIPLGLALKSTADSVPDGVADVLTVSNFVFANLVPSTLGNIIGGSLVVGGAYWVSYLLPEAPAFRGSAARSNNKCDLE
ncbi:MAG: formate/nitrite transporter family protein [Acidobacteriota bacterium]|nr:formate/nitrite transporter family protein [Acidobacteriota bacterium]